MTIDHLAEGHHKIDNHGDGDGVTERDRYKREENHSAALPIEPKGHGEQPAHGGVEPVKGAEPDQDQPRPTIHDPERRLEKGPLEKHKAPVRSAGEAHNGKNPIVE